MLSLSLDWARVEGINKVHVRPQLRLDFILGTPDQAASLQWRSISYLFCPSLQLSPMTRCGIEEKFTWYRTTLSSARLSPWSNPNRGFEVAQQFSKFPPCSYHKRKNLSFSIFVCIRSYQEFRSLGWKQRDNIKKCCVKSAPDLIVFNLK